MRACRSVPGPSFVDASPPKCRTDQSSPPLSSLLLHHHTVPGMQALLSVASKNAEEARTSVLQAPCSMRSERPLEIVLQLT